MSQLYDRVNRAIREVESYYMDGVSPRSSVVPMVTNMIRDIRVGVLKEVESHEIDQRIAKLPPDPKPDLKALTLKWCREQDEKRRREYEAEMTKEPERTEHRAGLLPFSTLSSTGELKFMVVFFGMLGLIGGLFYWIVKAAMFVGNLFGINTP